MLMMHERVTSRVAGCRWRLSVALTVLGGVVAGAAPGADTCPGGLFVTEFHDADDQRVHSLELADLDQDGVDELLALCTDRDILRTYTLESSGRYVPRDVYEFDTSVFRMTTGDLNEDGRADVVVVSDTFGKVFVRLAESDGSLGTEIEWSDGNRARGVEIADLDGDGHLDVAKANRLSLDVTVFHGTGDGSFDRVTSWPVKLTPNCMTADDIDQDGDIDLLVGGDDDPDGVSILRNQGDGTFIEHRLVWSARQIDHLTVADLDGDGYRDIVTCNDIDGADILLGRPGGLFAFGQHFDGDRPVASAVVDADHDGDLDLLLVTVAGLVGWQGNGAGGFSDPILVDPHFRGFDLIAIPRPERETFDVFGPASSNYGIIVSRGTTAFERTQPIEIPTRIPSGSTLSTHDLNGDKWPDVIARFTQNPADRVLAMFLGGPGGVLEEHYVLDDVRVETYQAADLDGDESVDVLTVESTDLAYEINWRRGLGDGTLGDPVLIRTMKTFANLAVGMANDDAHVDLFVRTYNANGQLEVAFGSESGMFGAFSTVTPLVNPDRFDVSDMTGDGIDDVVIFFEEPGRIDVYVGDGRGGYAPQVVYEDVDELDALRARDVDHDGEPELLLASEDDVRILRGSVSKSFSLDRVLPINSADDVRVGDVNGDGLDDIVVDAYGFFVFLGDPSGEFVQASGHLGGRVADLALADMNLDGAADVVIATATSVGGISVFLNQCDTTSCPADLDGSGSVDFADLLSVLGAWGTDGADVTGDGFTDFDDVVAIIAAWGAC